MPSGQDVKGDHPQAMKDIDQDMEDLIEELMADARPKDREGGHAGDVFHADAGISPVGLRPRFL